MSKDDPFEPIASAEAIRRVGEAAHRLARYLELQSRQEELDEQDRFEKEVSFQGRNFKQLESSGFFQAAVGSLQVAGEVFSANELKFGAAIGAGVAKAFQTSSEAKVDCQRNMGLKKVNADLEEKHRQVSALDQMISSIAQATSAMIRSSMNF